MKKGKRYINLIIICIMFIYSVIIGLLIKDLIKDYNVTILISLILSFVFMVLSVILIIYFNLKDKKDLVSKEDLNNKLKQSEKIRSDLESYLSKVSHELRTPLNGVLGMNLIAKDNLENENFTEVKNCLNSIEASGKYLLSIINDVLDLSKISHGKMILQNEVFLLAQLVDEIKDLVKTQIQKKGLSFNIESNIDNLYILTDRVKLSQILTNLISNAIKYNKDNGRVDLIIKKINLPKNKVRLEIKVKDTGIGMTEEEMTTIFDEFVGDSLKTGCESTGLGLAITKSLVNLLNGKIYVESVKDEGSCFKVEFVFDRVLNAITKNASEIDFDIEGLRCLVCEDNDINSLICETHLKKFGIECVRAKNGQEAYELYMKSEINYYDFILMDIQMPILNGYEATTKIRESKRADNNIIIIAMTADAFTDDVNKAYLYKMNGHIAKPIIVKNMMDTIRDSLNNK